ncbi:MAG: hypothetical protein M1830_010795 [Pleopsidium flavum]|nr:MAG: hypothetical protein M1830_010795 [Pleopsidium flavum]
MAQVSLPVDHFISTNTNVDNGIGTDVYAMRPTCVSSPPEPNPPFIFPTRRNLSSSTPASPATFSKRSMSSGTPDAFGIRRPNRISTSVLPAFDFHPSTSQSPVIGMTTPPESPTPSMTVAPRVGGHRRGGSEFIGGDGEAGGLGLMSTSPTKGEAALPPPASTTISGLPAGRRGHSHRRSGAISSHDVTLILKPTESKTSTQAGSVPCTPSNAGAQLSFEPALNTPGDTSNSPARPAAKSRGRRESAPASGQARARVGFSDTLEFIPRPLSIISSETSSSMSPVQGTHSVSGSITSLVSAGTASPRSAKFGSPILSTTFEDDIAQPRPKTAGAVMTGIESPDTTLLCRDMSSQQRHLSASASRTAINVTDGHLMSGYPLEKDHTSGEGTRSLEVSPKTTPAVECLEPDYRTSLAVPSEAVDPCLAVSSSPVKSKISPERRVPKKQKKVKSWAGSILARNGRHRSQKQKQLGRRTPTPPLRNYAPASLLDNLDIDFDQDSSCVIRTPTADVAPTPQVQTHFADWKPRESSSLADAEAMSPVIDLDAALGPFNTPSLGPDFRNALDRGFPAGKRAMHSSGATGGFAGPGMHYHRRAESAPEMVAFNLGHFGMQRLASSSTMADVFEEDEEDDEEAVKTSTTGGCSDKDERANEEGLGIGIQIVDTENMSANGVFSWSWDENGKSQRGVKRKGSGLSEGERRHFVSAVKQERSTGSLNSEAILEETGPVEIVQADEVPRPSVISRSSDDSTITPTVSHDPIKERPASAPMNFAYPAPEPQPATPETFSSAFSSPDFSKSLFDTPRVTTASSSFTDRHTLISLLYGEPGPELRMSVEDVPSLTSSASTMTNVHPAGRFSSSAGTRSSGERSLSVSAAETPRPRCASAGKRSSLASLSRLVGSSYGERSKLSIEERAQPDNSLKPEKKKGNRISRLIHFWKSKEKHESV